MGRGRAGTLQLSLSEGRRIRPEGVVCHKLPHNWAVTGENLRRHGENAGMLIPHKKGGVRIQTLVRTAVFVKIAGSVSSGLDVDIIIIMALETIIGSVEN